MWNWIKRQALIALFVVAMAAGIFVGFLMGIVHPDEEDA